MDFVKHTPVGGWDFGEAFAAPVKVSGRGLRGDDLSQFVKRARDAAPEFLPVIRSGAFGPGEVPLHAIALGATEFWGANRNGDGFKKADCEQYHPGFVKFAHWFRDHKNGPDDPRYGAIKASAYNDKMGRIELLIGLFGDKAAAERGAKEHGYSPDLARVADRELQDIEAGRDLPASMSTKIAFDVCAACNNRARNKDEYCTEKTCPAGGCRNNLGRVVKVAGDLFRLYVDNPKPLWFDFSGVGRQADWTAYAAAADYAKSAHVRPASPVEIDFERTGPSAASELAKHYALCKAAAVAANAKIRH